MNIIVGYVLSEFIGFYCNATLLYFMNSTITCNVLLRY